MNPRILLTRQTNFKLNSTHTKKWVCELIGRITSQQANATCPFNNYVWFQLLIVFCFWLRVSFQIPGESLTRLSKGCRLSCFAKKKLFFKNSLFITWKIIQDFVKCNINISYLTWIVSPVFFKDSITLILSLYSVGRCKSRNYFILFTFPLLRFC